jgi:hypothetical protein
MHARLNPEKNRILWCLLNRALYHKDAELVFLTTKTIGCEPSKDIEHDGRQSWRNIINYFESPKLLGLHFKRAKKEFESLKLIEGVRADVFTARFYTLMRFIEMIRGLVGKDKDGTYGSVDFTPPTSNYKLAYLTKVEKKDLHPMREQYKASKRYTLDETTLGIMEEDLSRGGYFDVRPPKTLKTAKDAENKNKPEKQSDAAAPKGTDHSDSKFRDLVFNWASSEKDPEKRKAMVEHLKELKVKSKEASKDNNSGNKGRRGKFKRRRVSESEAAAAAKNKAELWDAEKPPKKKKKAKK